MKLTIGLIFLITAQAHGVETRNCPKRFIVEYSRPKVVSADTLRQELGRNNKEAESIRQRLEKKSYKIEEFVFIGRKVGRCEYRGTSGLAVLATSKGKDWLRLEYGGGNLGVYITISRYAPNGLLADGNASFGYIDSYRGIFDAFLGVSSVKFK